MPRPGPQPRINRYGLSQTTMHVLSDGLYPAAKFDRAERYFVKYDELWPSVRERILEDWIRERPGTRPSYWWLHDAPDMAVAELVDHGWDCASFAPKLKEPRLRVGGVEQTVWERFPAVVPVFVRGIPKDWDSVDPTNPPRFESESAYLDRHGLLDPGERRRLSSADFEPE